MKILITGSGGAIGTPLTAELKRRGNDVWECDLGHDPAEDAQYRRCDIGHYRQLQHLLDEAQPALVYNCAAEFGRWNGEAFYENLWQTNVIGYKHLLTLQERRGFRMVHFSSSEVYGDYGDVMLESVMDQCAVRQMNDYAMTKRVNEMQTANSVGETVLVRLFNVYGPGEHYSPYRSVNARFIYSALKGLRWVVHQGHVRTSTYIDDAVRTLANIAQTFRPGAVYNIGGRHDSAHTIEELSDAVLDVTGADPALVDLLPPEGRTTKRKLVDCSRAAKDLGHEGRVDLRAGVKFTYDWMKSVYGRVIESPDNGK